MNYLMNVIFHINMLFKRIFYIIRKECLIPLALTLFTFSSPALSADLSDSILDLESINKEQAVPTSTNSPRPLSRIAENVTVINHDQIERLNAHTLTDILYFVSGIQLNAVRTPGDTLVSMRMNGMGSNDILFLIDGIEQNDPHNNRPDPGIIPASYIERIEIIKGAASTAWGAALGGVINVVTKSANFDKQVSGTLSTSYGERSTSDNNAEVTGSFDRFGYYLSGGNLYSKGLIPGNRTNLSNLFSKLSYRLPTKGNISLTGSLLEGFRGIEENTLLDYKDTTNDRKYSLALHLSQPLTQSLTLNVNSHVGRIFNNTTWGQITYDPPYVEYQSTRQENSSKAELSWLISGYSLTAGAAYKHYEITSQEVWSAVPDPEIHHNLDTTGIYLNGSAEFGRLTILPGIRYDHTIIGKDAVRYNLGGTFKLTEKTVIRLYAADGYGLPELANPNHELQKIWTTQGGIESSDIPYLWVKGALYYSRASNVEMYDYQNGDYFRNPQTYKGFELELKTNPLFGFSSTIGYTYIDSYVPGNSNFILNNVPANSLKMSVNYACKTSGTSAILFGNYVWWKQTPLSENIYYRPIIWDLHLNQKLLPTSELSPEIFFSGHNLFNGSQYNYDLYKNASRWVEGGVRFKF